MYMFVFLFIWWFVDDQCPPVTSCSMTRLRTVVLEASCLICDKFYCSCFILWSFCVHIELIEIKVMHTACCLDMDNYLVSFNNIHLSDWESWMISTTYDICIGFHSKFLNWRSCFSWAYGSNYRGSCFFCHLLFMRLPFLSTSRQDCHSKDT